MNFTSIAPEIAFEDESSTCLVFVASTSTIASASTAILTSYLPGSKFKISNSSLLKEASKPTTAVPVLISRTVIFLGTSKLELLTTSASVTAALNLTSI